MATASGTPSVCHPLGEKFKAGTVVCVGRHRIEILNYIAEGGFAQIYSVKFLEYLNEFDNDANSSNNLKAGDLACLKRVIVNDESGLNELRNEVDVMKRLIGAPTIVQYYDSNASRRNNGNGFEVLLLMELCPNKSLLDYMNQRLATKLTEKEILKIMYDVVLAIARMHYLDKPLIHRDIKIENVLVDSKNNFKLCDFGSACTAFPIVTTHQEIAMLTQDIYVHTTPQYRSPEMIDLYRCLPIDEKSDIWALGIFLYKLLFFTTPFEMTGQFAILHSKYEFPANNYSSKLINLVIIMLSENPNLRPNIFQVMYQVCSIINTEVPIHDKYQAGPYKFEEYTQFQNNVQNMQYEMYMIQKKKAENNGKLDQIDNTLLNRLFTTSFNIAPNIPTESTDDINNSASKLVVRSESDNVSNNNTTDVLQHKESRSVSPHNDKNSRETSSSNEQVVMEQPQNKNDNDNNNLQHGNSKYASRNMEQVVGLPFYPTVAELDNYMSNDNVKTEDQSDTKEAQIMADTFHLAPSAIQQNQKSYGSISSDGKSLSSVMPRQDLTREGSPYEFNTRSEVSVATTMKQHKSNNPFPKINYKSINQNNARYAEEQHSVKNQQASPEATLLVNQHNQTMSYKQFQPYAHPINASPQQEKGVPSPNNIQTNRNPYVTEFSNQAMNEQFHPSSQLPIQPQIVTPQDISPRIAQQQYRNQQQVDQAPAVPPHPKSSKKLTGQNNYSSNESTPPAVPPHPKRDQEPSLIDMSPPRKLDLNRTSESVKNEVRRASQSHIHRSASLSNNHRKLRDPPTSESIDLDLDDIKKKSIDAKFQRLRFESQLREETEEDLNDAGKHSNKDRLNIPAYHSKNNSNHSIAVSSVHDVKRNNGRARQSLDLERVRREDIHNTDGGKRRSILSMFRGDKK